MMNEADPLEFTCNDIRIDPDYETNDDGCIKFCIECWFNVDEKFGTNVNTDENDSWVNFWGEYNPNNDDLSLGYVVESDDTCSDYVEYTPTENERSLIIQMVKETCMEVE